MSASRLLHINHSIIALPFVRDVLRAKACPDSPAGSHRPSVRVALRPWTVLVCAVLLLLCWPMRGYSQTSIVAPVGLQSWWPGESNFNDIRGPNPGTNAGGVTFVPGEVGQAFHFDGTANSYFTVPNSATFAPASNQVTVAAWVRPNYAVSNVVDTVFSKRDSCGFNRSYILDITKAGLVPIGYPLGSIVWSASVAGDDAISTVPVPNDGLYHFIVGTYDGANMNVYLDGVLVGQKPHTGSIPITSDLPYVGKQSGCGDLAYADIDELQFYNRGLTPSEVSAIYSTANAGVSRNAPVPQINQPAAPVTATSGGSAFTLTVNGTGFVPGASVNWNGSPRSTTFVSNTQVTATITATDIAASGTASVTVFNPSPGGGTSNVVFVEITVASASVGFGLSGDFGAGGTLPWNIIVGDFNGDGKLDLAVATSGDNTISVLVGNGDGTFGPPVNSLTNFFPNSITSGDFNGDGKLDLAVAKGNKNTVAILIGNGDGHFQAPVEYSVGQSPKSVTVGDFNSDGNLDIAVANQNSNTISVLLGKGDGTFGAAIDYPTGAVPVYLIAGDFNRDGVIDLAVANRSSSTISILLGTGDGTFATKTDYATGSAPIQLSAADLNGDSVLDLVVVNQSSGTVSILSGSGDGTFGSRVDYSALSNLESVVVADLNGDGKLDLVAGNGGFFSVFFGNGDATFQPRRDFVAPFSHHPGVVAGDFNGDGRLDVAVTDPETNKVSVFLQSPDATVSSSSLAFGTQNVGTPSSAQSVTLTNNGSFPLHIGAVSLTGTNFGDFSETDNCVSSSPLAPGNTCTISITFTPSALGSRSATLQVTDDASGSPQGVNLSGTGIGTAPAINSPNNATFTASIAGSFTVTALGSPTPTLRETGTLPGGVIFNATTGVLSGTPATGTGGTYGIQFTASNGVGSDAVQNFTLTVRQAPTITSAASTTFTVGALGSFTVGVTGFPAPTLSETGPLPSGVTFNGATHALSGTPGTGTAGTYNLIFTVSNGVGANDVQNFLLTVNMPTVATVTLNPTTVPGGAANSIGTVTLNALAVGTAAQRTVILSSSNTAAATVRAAVTVAAGATSANFTVTSQTVAADSTANISATLNGGTQSAVLTVTPRAGVASLTLNSTTVLGGAANAVATVTLNAPAAGAAAQRTVTLSSSAPSAASVPASVTVAAGATTATFTVTSHAVSDVINAVITATLNGSATATLTVNPLFVAQVTLNPTTVPGGAANSIGTVTLNAPAVGTAVQRTVTLSSSNTAAATVPATVTVAAGATSANFTVTSQTVAADSTANISATLNGGTQSAVLTVTPRAGVTSLTLNSTTVLGGAANAVATVTLNAPAAGTAAQRTVTLSSSATSAASVPASVTVAAGATTATFTVTSHAVSDVINAVITATLNGSATATLTVNPLFVTRVTLNPDSVPGGAANSIGTVTLNAPAVGTAAQRTVALSSSNTAAATVPASVTVAAGATTATFTVTSHPVSAVTDAVITATLNGFLAASALAVNPLVVTSVTLNPTTVPGGAANSIGTVTLNAPAVGTTAQRTVTLSSSNTAAATVRATVTVAAGATSANFTVTSQTVAADSTANISATLNGGTQSAVLTVTP